MRVLNLPVEGLGGRDQLFRDSQLLSSHRLRSGNRSRLRSRTGLAAHDTQVGVVRVVDTAGQTSQSERVVGELVNGSHALRDCKFGLR